MSMPLYIDPQTVEGCTIYAPIPVRVGACEDGEFIASAADDRFWSTGGTERGAVERVMLWMVSCFRAYTNATKLTPIAKRELAVLRKYIRTGDE